MNCTRHPFEDGVGVCASCLHERLLDLAATANEKQPSSQAQGHLPSPASFSVPHTVPRAASSDRSERSSVLSTLFSRSGISEPDRKPQRSSSWISALFRRHRRRKKTSWQFTEDQDISPERGGGKRPEDEGRCDALPICKPWRPNPSPMRWSTPEHDQHRNSGGLTGLALCCGPQMEARPNHRQSLVAGYNSSEEMSRAAVGTHRHRHASAGRPVLWRDW